MTSERVIFIDHVASLNPRVPSCVSSRVWIYFLVLVCVSHTAFSSGMLPDEQALLTKLFSNYDSSVRPVFNSSKNVEVYFGFTLMQILDLDEKNQWLTLNAWLEMTWVDDRIEWDKEAHNDIEVIRLPAKLFWLPDVMLYNNADDYTTGFMPTTVTVQNDGQISWGPPVRLKSACKVDITFFPFDQQICKLKFGSWTYDKAQVDLLNLMGEVELSGYSTNGEWSLTKYRIVRNEVTYPISPAVYPDVTVILTIQRRIFYYVLNILFPCLWLNILSVLTCCLPPDACEKMTLSITILLAYCFFTLLVADSMPPTSEFVPLIGIYLTVSMAITSISVILAVVVMRLHFSSPHQRQIPPWIRLYVLGYLARLVRCSCAGIPCPTRLYNRTGSGDNVADLKDMQMKCLRELEAFTRGNESDTLTVASNPDHAFNEHNMATVNYAATLEDSGGVNFKRDNSNSAATMEDILKYLKVLVIKSDEEDAETEVVDEWKQVALVVDRLFFWMFLIITVFSSIIILVIVPSFKYIEDGGL